MFEMDLGMSVQTQPHVNQMKSGLLFQPLHNLPSVSVYSRKSHRHFFKFTLKDEIKLSLNCC